jgi:L-aspartate oxidase
MFREMNEEIHKFYRHAQLHDDLIGLRNSIEVAHMVLDASVINKKSAGCFYRED